MSVAYFDSSILLAILLQEPRSKFAARLWVETEDRVSSILLRAECLIGIRRSPISWKKIAEEKLKTFLEEVEIKPVDLKIMTILEQNALLGGLRTLDAIHLATASFFNEASDEPLKLYTFDQTMATVAEKLGFVVESASPG